MKISTQRAEILKCLESGERLTTLQAVYSFGALRAGARIHELRKLGHNIKTDMITTRSGKRVAEYRMEAV